MFKMTEKIVDAEGLSRRLYRSRDLLSLRGEKEGLKTLVQIYFQGITAKPNPIGFTRENHGTYISFHSGEREGYMFFPGLTLNLENHEIEENMENQISKQRGLGRIVDRKFMDYQERISGFHWRQNGIK